MDGSVKSVVAAAVEGQGDKCPCCGVAAIWGSIQHRIAEQIGMDHRHLRIEALDLCNQVGIVLERGNIGNRREVLRKAWRVPMAVPTIPPDVLAAMKDWLNG